MTDCRLTLCGHCFKPLKDCAEVHAVSGTLYCSRECAIADITNDIIMNAKESAIEAYACLAEVVATAEILKDEMCELVEDNNSTHNEHN